MNAYLLNKYTENEPVHLGDVQARFRGLLFSCSEESDYRTKALLNISLGIIQQV